jgi:nicotinamide mononucleotide transporter
MWEAIREYVWQNPVELLGFGFTVVSIWLNTRQNAWGWLWGMVGIVCYAYISLKINLLGSFFLNLYFFALSIYGWYWWKWGKKEAKNLPVSHCAPLEIVILAIVAILSFVLLSSVLYGFKNISPMQYWDVETTAFSLVGQWLLARKKIENWLVWLWVNLQYVLIYFYQNLLITSLLYVVLALLALQGWRRWQKEIKK